MQNNISYRILNIGLRVGFCLLAATGIAKAQQYNPTTPTESDMYCSGLITDKPAPSKMYVISGEESSYKTTFSTNDAIYINAGGEQGVRVGDQFEITRPITDMMAKTVWFKYQQTLSRAMGTRYADIGRLKVVHVDAKISTAVMTLGCTVAQRGDIVVPFAARTKLAAVRHGFGIE